MQICGGISSSEELTSTGTVDERALPRQQEPAQKALPTIPHHAHWPLVRWELLFSLPQIMRYDIPPPRSCLLVWARRGSVLQPPNVPCRGSPGEGCTSGLVAF